MNRTLLTGVVAGLTALVVSGAASFWLTSVVISVPDAPGSCPVLGSATCFGSVTVDDVVKPLRARGFACPDYSDSCQLLAGAGAYYVSLETVGDSVYAYRADVRFDQALGPSQRALDFLAWLASMPFTHDPATASAARAWMLRQVGAHAHGRAAINGYSYELQASGDQFGAFLPECLSGAGCPAPLRGYLMLRVRSTAR